MELYAILQSDVCPDRFGDNKEIDEINSAISEKTW
jgi:hypothetical protein